MTEIGQPPAHLSHSQVETLLGCGQRYYLERILKAPQVPAFYFVGGSVVHGVTEEMDHEAWHTGEIWGPERIDSECRRLFNSLIEIEKAIEPDTSKWGMGGRAPNKEGEDWWRAQAPVMVQRWRDWITTTNLEIWELPNGEPAIEVEAVVTFGGQPVKMGIDRIMQDPATGDLIVVDLKAGSREPQGYQLPLYGEAVHRTIGVPVQFGAYWMARKGTLTLPKDLRKMIGDLDNRFEKARKMIDNEIYLAVPGMFCGSCGVREFCSAQGGDPAPLFGRVS